MMVDLLADLYFCENCIIVSIVKLCAFLYRFVLGVLTVCVFLYFTHESNIVHLYNIYNTHIVTYLFASFKYLL